MTAPRDSQLGSLAVRKGFASPDEVQTALELQGRFEPSADRPVARVGEILVEMGALTPDMLRVLLEEQAALRERALSESSRQTPVPESSAAGRLVVRSPVAVSVNGAPLASPRAIGPGDVLRVGNAVIVFEGSAAGPVLLPPSEAPKEAATPAPGVLGRVTGAAKRAVEGVTTRIFKRPKPEEGPPAPASDGLGAKLMGAAQKTGETFRKLMKEVGKLRPKDRLAANRKRDELLQELGRAGLKDSRRDGPEARAAREALSALQKAEDHTSLRGSATTPSEASAQRNAIRAARERVELTLVRLGWELLQAGAVPAGLEAQAAEIRKIEEALKDQP
jgi:hypothetical protein